MKTKRIVAAILAVVLAGTCIGCKKESTGKDDRVKLTWLFAGAGKLADSDMVWEEYNKQLEKVMPDVKIEFKNVATADYAEKWKLMMAAQESVDIAWVGWMLDLQSEVTKGAFTELNDLIDEYGKDMKKEIPDFAMKKGMFEGKLYMIPIYQELADQQPIALRTIKSLSDKYLDKAKAEEIFKDETKPLKRADMAVFEEFFEKLKQNGELRKGVSETFSNFFADRIGRPTGLQPIAANAYIDVNNFDGKVYNLLSDFPETKEYYEMKRDWFEKGYIRNDILGLQDWRSDEGKENGYVMWAHADGMNTALSESEKYGFDIDAIRVRSSSFVNHTPPLTAITILSTCKEPEKAMQVIDLMNTAKGKDLYNLLCYGIEGTHYNKVSENRIEMITQGTPFSSQNKYGYNKWIVGNILNGYENQLEPEGYNDYVKEVNSELTVSPIMGFSFDTTEVTNEIAQYDAIMKEYSDIGTGAFADWEKRLDERNKKLKSAGCDKIVEEAQKQLNEWLKKNK